MAGPVQWSIDQLWAGLQQLENRIKAVQSDLNADKLRLQALYSATRQDANKVRAADNQKLLQPLIHQNSVLRLSYLAPIKEKFNAAVSGASGLLKQAGYSTPQLSGLGDFVIAPAAVVAIVVVALSAVAVVEMLTHSQRVRTDTVARIINDTRTTAEQKIALLNAHTKELQKEHDTAPPPLGLDFGKLVLPLAIVAVILLGPQLLRMFQSRRAAA